MSSELRAGISTLPIFRIFNGGPLLKRSALKVILQLSEGVGADGGAVTAQAGES